MYLKSIKIKNFRKIKDTICSFNPGLNLIVGPNDSGKTAVIDAVRFVLKQIVDDYSRLSIEDFNNEKKDIELEVRYLFDDCKNEKELTLQAAIFAEYLSFTEDNKPELRIWYSVKSNENDIRFPQFRVGPTKEVSVDMDVRCRENLKVVYLRPLRDAEQDLKSRKGSRISKILQQHNDIINNQGELKHFLQSFKESTESFFGSGNGGGIQKEIDRLLKAFDEQGELAPKDIKIGPTENLDSCLKVLEKLSLYYDRLPLPGLGTHNMIYIAAELLHLGTQNVPKLLLVEEIEAHLHPQRQLKIIKALEKESVDKGIQMILTTHSSNLASVVLLERLCVFHEGVFYSLDKGKTHLANGNYSYLARLLDVTKANLFFSRGIILVEGVTELLLLPEFANILGVDFTNRGVSVISVNGLSFEHFVNIFKRTEEPYNQIPVAVVTDADKKCDEKIKVFRNALQDVNNKVECFVGAQISSTVDISKNRGTTFEKIVLSKTTELKKLYLNKYNSLKVKKRAKLVESMDLNFLYSRIQSVKAPLAQEIAQDLSSLTDEQKKLIKAEIERHLPYLVEAIKFASPDFTSQTDS